MLQTSDSVADETLTPALLIQPLWECVQPFDGLDPATMAAIATCLQLRPFSAGDALIQQDRQGDELFIVRSGVVQVSHIAAPDAVSAHPSRETPPHEVILRRLVGGDCFGEMSRNRGCADQTTHTIALPPPFQRWRPVH